MEGVEEGPRASGSTSQEVAVIFAPQTSSRVPYSQSEPVEFAVASDWSTSLAGAESARRNAGESEGKSISNLYLSVNIFD